MAAGPIDNGVVIFPELSAEDATDREIAVVCDKEERFQFDEAAAEMVGSRSTNRDSQAIVRLRRSSISLS
jgi:hypothetical protein